MEDQVKDNTVQINELKIAFAKMYAQMTGHISFCEERHDETKASLSDLKKTNRWIVGLIITTLVAIIIDLVVKST